MLCVARSSTAITSACSWMRPVCRSGCGRLSSSVCHCTAIKKKTRFAHCLPKGETGNSEARHTFFSQDIELARGSPQTLGANPNDRIVEIQGNGSVAELFRKTTFGTEQSVIYGGEVPRAGRYRAGTTIH